MQEGSSTWDAKDAAHKYADEGMTVLPANPGEKEARIENWPKLIIGPNAVDEYFSAEKLWNIVRVNGTNSGGRGDIDLDCDEALQVAPYVLPEGLLRFGRDGREPGHVEVKFADTVPRTTSYSITSDSITSDAGDKMLVELRADGSQTLLPPSVYPDGDRCVWHPGEVLEAHAVTLNAYAQDIAIAALLLMHYPDTGVRHQYWLGAIGMLIKAKHDVGRVRGIVEAVVRCAKDPELHDRMRVVDTTSTKFMLGEKVGGITKLKKVSEVVPKTLKHWLGIGKITDSGLTHIVVNDRPLRDVSDEATDALVEANNPPEIFSRAGMLARLAKDSEGRPMIQDIDRDRLRYRMTRTAEYLKVSDEMSHVFPPDAVVGDVLAAKAFSFPRLDGITQSPVLRPSGTILDRPGYDKETGLIYVPESKVEIEVPFEPTEDEVESAVDLLRELYIDFPFVDDASFANMLGLTLTPVVRPAYPGPTPLAVIDKPAMGTGASLLSEVVCAIATAQPAAMMSPPEHDEETRKQITSVLRTGRPIIVIDNLGSELKNASWARVLTSTVWEDRILGHSKVATLPQRSTWITTGNNIKIGGDLPRRCYWIRMDAKMAKPWDRSPESFTHPNLLEWVGESRGELLGALLTLARHWYAEGRPRWNGRPPGSFEGWARVVGGILETAGIPGFLGNTKEMLDRTTAGTSEWETFLTAWHNAFGENSLTAKELVKRLHEDEFEALRETLPAELASHYIDGSTILARKFGEAFAEKDSVRYGDNGIRIERAGQNRNKVALWRVVEDSETDPPPNKETKKETKKEEASQQEEQPRGRGVTRGQSSQTPGDSVPSQQQETSNLQEVAKLPNFLGARLDDPARPRDPALFDASTPSEAPKTSEVTPIGRKFTLVDDEAPLRRCVAAVRRADDMVAVDIETTGRDWWSDEVRVVSLTTVARKTFVVDASKVDPAPLYRALEEKHLVFHHAAFDIPFLRRAGCDPRRFSCTMVLSQLRHAGREGVFHSLADVVKRYAPAHEVKTVDIDHEVWKKKDLPEDALEYAAEDTRALLDVYSGELEALREAGLGAVAELEDRFLDVVVEVTDAGMPVDPEKWTAVIEEAKERKRELGEQLDEMIGGAEVPEKFVKANSDKPEVGKINWSSPEQKVWAVEALSLTVPTRWDYKKKTERKTLDKDHLHLLDHPIAEGLREYQTIANFPSTYARALRERFSEGRMFADWKQLEARTGRMSCCNPPMHNIPKKTKLREAIVAPPGEKILALDFSQIEPRILAAISRDTALLRAFREGLDIYRFVAEKVTGTPMDEISGNLRAVFKTIVLGMIYGMGPVGLTLRIHRDIDSEMPVEKIEEYFYGFFDAFPEAEKWRKDLEAEFDKGSRETRTLLGRRRLDVENRRQRWNAPIQGTATDAFRAAAAALLERRDEVGGFRIIALIHDEVVLLVPEETAELVEEWAAAVMADAAAEIVNANLPKRLHIETKVDSGAGATLQEAKDKAA